MRERTYGANVFDPASPLDSTMLFIRLIATRSTAILTVCRNEPNLLRN